MWGLLKLATLLVIAGWSLWSERERLLHLSELPASGLAAAAIEIVLPTGLKMAAALVVLGLADYVYQRWRWEQDLRMSDQELREEQQHGANSQIAEGRRRFREHHIHE